MTSGPTSADPCSNAPAYRGAQQRQATKKQHKAQLTTAIAAQQSPMRTKICHTIPVIRGPTSCLVQLWKTYTFLVKIFPTAFTAPSIAPQQLL